MSVADSREGRQVQGVKMFGRSQLVPAVATAKWDRVRIVCSQPYNKVRPFFLKSMVNPHFKSIFQLISE
jgi:hypothetical protein